MVRLGDGTDESHRRAQRALDELWPYTAEWFAPDAVADAGIGPRWVDSHDAWLAAVRPVLDEATLTIPAPTAFRGAGRIGVHSEYLGHLLSEMQYLQRAYPGATW